MSGSVEPARCPECNGVLGCECFFNGECVEPKDTLEQQLDCLARSLLAIQAALISGEICNVIYDDDKRMLERMVRT